MSLKDYHKKRDFKRTPEPAGKKPKARKRKLLYLIQKHAASHLHYDFRIELEGVLKSWAVPKGPSLDPTVKRLAMHVEDHPIEYGSFQGIIPKGEYGGGTVMLWDTGTWEIAEGNAKTAYKNGDMKFVLYGKRLRGLWKLIRIKSSPKSWLLIKGRDKYAKPESEFNITEKLTRSVTTNQTMDQIADQSQKVWHSDRTENDDAIGFPLTHPNRVLYPEEKITKLQLAQYYEHIRKWILPYIINRPLTLVRCPKGMSDKCFYQKHPNGSTDKALHKIRIKEKEKTEDYIYIKDIDGLIALVQMGVLEIHPWACRIDNIEKPDYMIFDLDPDEDMSWKKVIAGALYVKDQLDAIGLKSFLKATGGKGLHIVLPIKRLYTWDQIKAFSQTFVDYVVAQNPKMFVGNMSKAKRVGKIYLDYLRNQRGATAVAPYSTRARKHATVATPIAWEELTPSLVPAAFTVKTVPNRLKNLKKDPWKNFYKSAQSLQKLKAK